MTAPDHNFRCRPLLSHANKTVAVVFGSEEFGLVIRQPCMFLAFFQAVLQLVVSPRPLSLTVTYTHIIISTYILSICQHLQLKTAQLLTVELQ